VEYYQVFSVGGPDRLSDTDGEKVFAEWDREQPRLELDKITPDLVYAKLDANLRAAHR
jgi:hypothetical protein